MLWSERDKESSGSGSGVVVEENCVILSCQKVFCQAQTDSPNLTKN